jgi:hypothetical protein
MALSTNTYIYAGGAQTFTVNFALGFIQRSDVQVRVNGAVDGGGDPAYTNFTWIDDSNITVTPTLTIGDSVQLLRTVSKTELKVDFGSSADVTPANLNVSAKHGLMVYQELVDGRIEGAESPIDAADRSSASANQAAASAVQTAADAVAVAAGLETLELEDHLRDADIGVSVQAYDAATSKTDEVQTYTASQIGEVTALTDAASVTTDLALSNNYSLTLAGNRTLVNPTNIVAGQSGSLFITQDATGSRTLAFGSYWKFVGGVAPVLSTAASSVDRLDYVVKSSTEVHAVVSLDVK